MNNYTFPVSSGLLTADHVEKMGERLWCFLWCVNRTTEDVSTPDDRLGKVLGGHAVQPERIADELGLTEETVRHQLEQLERDGYIRLDRMYGGYCILVKRSIKWRKWKQASLANRTDRNSDPMPLKSLVEGLKERLAAREAEQAAAQAAKQNGKEGVRHENMH